MPDARRTSRLLAAMLWTAVPTRWPFLRREILSRRTRLVPVGWVLERDLGRDAVILGPWWAMLDGLWGRYVYTPACELALRLGAAVEPYPGCYYNELTWWPRNG